MPRVQAKSNSSVAAGTTATVTLDGAPTQDNYLIAHILAGAVVDEATFSAAGWTKGVESTDFVEAALWWKKAGAGESATVNVPLAGSAGWDLGVIEWSGIVPTNPVDLIHDSSPGAGQGSISLGNGQTPAQADEVAFMLAGFLTTEGDRTVTGWAPAITREFTNVLGQGGVGALDPMMDGGFIVLSAATAQTYVASFNNTTRPSGVFMTMKLAAATPTASGTASEQAVGQATATGSPSVTGTGRGQGVGQATARGTASVAGVAGAGGVGQMSATGTADPSRRTALQAVGQITAQGRGLDPSLTFYDVAERLRSCAMERLALTVSGPPERSCVVPGQIAWDGCDCGQLAVSIVRTFPSANFPTQAGFAGFQLNANCVPLIVADMLVQVVRCVPTPQGKDTTVPCDDLAKAARAMEADAYAVRVGVQCCLNELENDPTSFVSHWVINEQARIGPEGGCAGSELRLTVGVIDRCPCG